MYLDILSKESWHYPTYYQLRQLPTTEGQLTIQLIF